MWKPTNLRKKYITLNLIIVLVLDLFQACIVLVGSRGPLQTNQQTNIYAWIKENTLRHRLMDFYYCYISGL